jgi:sigma-B regulation protein RsbU (phosphoserine phosphatase)
MDKISKLNKFLQKRGNILVVTLAAVLLSLTLTILYFYSYNSIKKSISRLTESELRETSLKIKNVVNDMELALENNVWAAPWHNDSLWATEELVEHVVRDNIHVMGCGIGYVPSQNGWRRDGVFAFDLVADSTSNIDVRRMAYDYTQREWYQQVMLTGEPHWTDPYVGMTTHRLSTSYSMPVREPGGLITAVMFVDVALDWLNRVIKTEDINPHTKNLLISNTGEILVSPVDSLANTKKVSLALTGNDNDEKALTIERKMRNGETGTEVIYDSEGNRLYVHYAPVDKRVGWSMAIINKHKDIYADLHVMALKMLALVATGLVMLSIIMWLLRRSFKRINRIYAEKERISSELRVASNIQQAMIPKTFPPYPDRDDLQVYGLLEPAKEVGGDLFDFYIRDEKMFFCIGDVSGKGVPASLVMAVTRSLFRTISAHESAPVRIVELMNESMSDGNESLMFVTFFLGVLDLPTGRLRYCNAGHDAPLVVEANRLDYLPVEPNIPLGIMADFRFRGQEALINAHSIIFLYTDGLTEAENATHAQFGNDRMLEVAHRCQKYTDDTQLLTTEMQKAVVDFVAGAQRSDDLTMLSVAYTKEARTAKLKRSLTLPNDVQTIGQLSEFVEGVCEELEFDMEETMSMNLALEEAVVNVMNYAYPSGTVGQVQIVAEANDQRLKFTIIDSGSPFDPTAKEDVDTTLSAEDRPVGGLGIFLVRQLMDSINYERIDGQNVLTLRKRLLRS